MSELTGRLESLLRSLRLLATFSDQSQDAQLGEQFRKDLALLIIKYGHWPRRRQRGAKRAAGLDGVVVFAALISRHWMGGGHWPRY